MGEVDSDLEQLMGYMGTFGRYQLLQFFILALASVNAGVHMLSLVFVAASPSHRCFIPGVDEVVNGTVIAADWNATELSRWIPERSPGVLDSCHLLDPNTSAHMPCNEWVFDSTYHSSSRVIEWSLVCGRRWMGALAQSCYMLGLLFGSLLLGNQSDRFGRLRVFYFAAVLQLVVGVLVAFVPDFYSFLALRFLYGVGTVGTLSASFVLIMEMVGTSVRTGFGMAFQCCFSIGIALVALWGYLVRDRQMLQVVYGLHGALLLPHWWLVDESPRWLWSQGRTKEAIKIVAKASRMNSGDRYKAEIANFLRKDSVPTMDRSEKEATPVPSMGIIDLFKTPNMCKRMFNVSLNWFANSLVYYGLSLNTAALFGNPFLILFIAGMVDVPSYILTGVIMNRAGRRLLISSLLVLGGVACITAVYIPSDIPGGRSAGTAIVMLGKFFIAGSFAIIYNYTTELFPTVVRNTALGASSMCARISGALTPFITLLDSFDPTLPSVIFGCVAITSGVLSLFLPETLGRALPQSMEDGERFGDGDTAFTACCGQRTTRSGVRSRTVAERRDSASKRSLQAPDADDMS